MKKKKDVIRCPQCNAEVNPSDEFCECGKLLVLDEDYDAITNEQDEEASV